MLLNDDRVNLQHVPTGIVVQSTGYRSLYKMRSFCYFMLKGKLWSIYKGGYSNICNNLVRSYTDEDFNRLDIVDMDRK